MKRIPLVPLSAIVALLVLLTACGSPAAAPTAAPTAAPAAKPAAAAPTAAPAAPAQAAAAPTAAPAAPAAAAPAAPAAKPATTLGAGPSVTLKFATWSPEPITLSKTQAWFLDEVEKRANGRVKWEKYWGESLVAAKDTLDQLQAGVIDVAALNPSYYPGKMPLNYAGSLPGIGVDLYTTVRGFTDTIRKVPAMQQEFTKYGIRWLAPMGSGPYLLLTKKEIKSLDDLKGLKLRGLGLQAELVKAVGATPVSITPPEQYDALSRGTIDGAVSPAAGLTGYSLQEVAKFHTNINFGSAAYFMGMRQASWDKLPKDIQDLMATVGEEAVAHVARIYEIEGEGTETKKMVAAGVKLVQLPASVNEAVQKIAKEQILDKWAADQEAKGTPGKLIVETYVDLAKKAEASDPFLKKQ